MWANKEYPELIPLLCLWLCSTPTSRTTSFVRTTMSRLMKERVVVTQVIFHFAHLSLPWSIGWVALSFLFRSSFVRRPAMVTSDQISTFFNIYRHKSLILTQYHHLSTSANIYWLSTTKYQPVPQYTKSVLLTQYYQATTSAALYCITEKNS